MSQQIKQAADPLTQDASQAQSLAVAAPFHSYAAGKLLCETPSFFRIVALHEMNEAPSNASSTCPHANCNPEAFCFASGSSAGLAFSTTSRHPTDCRAAAFQSCSVSCSTACSGSRLATALRFGAMARKRVCAALWALVKQMLECMAKRSCGRRAQLVQSK